MGKTESKLPAGFKMRVFGATLAFFGIADSVMNLIVGIKLDGFFLFLIAAGIVLFIIGARQN